MIPQNFISALLDRANIVDVIGRYVKLKKAGRNFMACCPFHDEKTPSFSVSESKQFYKCFGCGKSGNAIGFVMEMEHLEFPQAVEKVASFYSLTVPQESRVRQAEQSQVQVRQRTLSAYMKEAADFYQHALSQSEKAQLYLRSRQISPDIQARYALGYAPEGWHALQALWGDKYQDATLQEVGLVLQKGERLYDAFRDRIMFPIRNPRGQVIGFGARTLKGDEQPKYLNSPETPIYHKGSELYGLYEGRDAIYKAQRAIVTEGYMDVIQLAQAGFTEAVAALGTSLTPMHVQKLLKITSKIYFSFDGDAAGRKAARRALEIVEPLVADGHEIRFVLLPNDHDPDSLIKQEGPHAYEQQLQHALTLSEFLKSILLEGKDLTYAESRTQLIVQAKPHLQAMTQAPLLRMSLIQELSQLAKLEVASVTQALALTSPASMRQSIQRASGHTSNWRPRVEARRAFQSQGAGTRPWGARSGHRYADASTQDLVPIHTRDVRERMLQCFLTYPVLLAQFEDQIVECFVGQAQLWSERIVRVWQAATHPQGHEQGDILQSATLLQRLEERQDADAALFSQLVQAEFDLETPLEAARLELRECFLALELERVVQQLKVCSAQGALDDVALQQLKMLHQAKCHLTQKVAQAREASRVYRRNLEQASQAQTSLPSDMVPDDRPKVRALQRSLLGLDDALAQKLTARVSEAKVTVAVDVAPMGVTPEPATATPEPTLREVRPEPTVAPAPITAQAQARRDDRASRLQAMMAAAQARQQAATLPNSVAPGEVSALEATPSAPMPTFEEVPPLDASAIPMADDDPDDVPFDPDM